MFSKLVKFVLSFLFSTKIIITPPSTSDITTIKGLNKFALIISWKKKPNDAAGIEAKKIIFKAVNSFNGLNFRQQIILNNNKTRIINDSKSTSLSSSLNLLQSYKNIFWIVGGLAKKGDKFNLPKKYFKNINCYIYGRNLSLLWWHC